MSTLAIFGQALLAMGSAFLVISLFPDLHPVYLAGIALGIAALLQPIRVQLQMQLSGQIIANHRTISDWIAYFQSLTDANSDSDRGWHAVIRCLYEGSFSDSVTVFRFHPESGLFRSDSAKLSFQASGPMAASLQNSNSVQEVSAIDASVEELAQLHTLHSRQILPLFGLHRLDGFLLIGEQLNRPLAAKRDISVLEAIASAFHSFAISQAPEWQTLSKELRDIQSDSVLCEWLYAQISRWIPSLTVRIGLYREESKSLVYRFVNDQSRRRPEQESVPFSAESDLASLVIGNDAPFFSDSSTTASQEHGLSIREPDRAWAGLPFHSSGAVLGMLILTRTAPFSESDRVRLIQFMELANDAFFRVSRQAQTTRSATQISELHRSARRLTAAGDTATILQILLEDAAAIAGSASGVLFLANRDGTWSIRKTLGEASPRPIAVSEEFIAAARNPIPTFIFQSAGEAMLRTIFPRARHAMFLPLHRKTQTPVVIVLADPAGVSPFPEEDKEAWSTFSSLAALAMDNADLSAQTDPSLRGVVEEMSSLQRFDQELHAAPDALSILSIALDWTMRRTNFPAGFALIPQEGAWQIAISRGYSAGAEPLPSCDLSFLSDALTAGHIVILRRDSPDAYSAFFPNAVVAIVVPIQRANQCLGALFLEADWESTPSVGEMDLLQRVSAHAANALANTQLRAEVQNANLAKSEFISFVAHELKTPMTSIRGYTDLLAQGAVGPINPAQANFLGTIRTNADRLANLVSDLNDVSRIESGRLRLEFSQCSLASALEEVLESLRSQIEAKEQTLIPDVSVHLPPVWADRGRLIQILSNLISNAHKYTPAGGSIHVTAERSPNRWDEAGAADVVHLTVQDSGLGISPQDQKAIFQKFFRAEDRSIRDLPGTGLGLHITRNLIELQGGRIWFESELRKGTTFHFTIPVASV
jgi:signal transduction histidine kinase